MDPLAIVCLLVGLSFAGAAALTIVKDKEDN